ncbi:MAG TPA: DUF4440 domain-containing protein [Lysobacter sp.]|nr:DUF4440 domain-containing protein [Lysobacter sp.]
MSTTPDAADAEVARALEALRAREPLFHRPEFGTTRADFERMTSDDFWEIGASGRRYGRAFVLDTLEQRHAQPHHDPWETSEFRCRALGECTWLLTYTLRQNERVSRRMTLWRENDDGWRALYHQGTLVQDAES